MVLKEALKILENILNWNNKGASKLIFMSADLEVPKIPKEQCFRGLWGSLKHFIKHTFGSLKEARHTNMD